MFDLLSAGPRHSQSAPAPLEAPPSFDNVLVVHDLSRAGRGAIVAAAALCRPNGQLRTHVYLHPREVSAYEELRRRHEGADEIASRIHKSVAHAARRTEGAGTPASMRTYSVIVDSDGDPVQRVLQQAQQQPTDVVFVPARTQLPRAWHQLAPTAYHLARRLPGPTWIHRSDSPVGAGQDAVIALLPSRAAADPTESSAVVRWGIATAAALGCELVFAWVDWPQSAAQGEEALRVALHQASSAPLPVRAIRFDASPKAGLMQMVRTQHANVLLVDRDDGRRAAFGVFRAGGGRGLGDRALFAAKRAACDVFLVG